MVKVYADFVGFLLLIGASGVLWWLTPSMGW